MAREFTPAAKAAAMIRKSLKAQGLDVKVTSSNFSMGNSVSVSMTDQRPDVCRLVEQYCANFRSGHFDAMTDCYEYSNRSTNLPQTKYLTVTNHMSAGMRDAIYQHVRQSWGGGEALPEAFDGTVQFHGQWMDQFIYRLFRDEDGTFWRGRLAVAA